MNVYLVHKFCRRVLHDQAFRAMARSDPASAVASMPFDETEATALLAGDVARLIHGGASGFFLLILSRFEVFSLDLETFNSRMRSYAGLSADQKLERYGDNRDGPNFGIAHRTGTAQDSVQ